MKEFHTLNAFKIPTSRLTLSLLEKLLSHVKIESNAIALRPAQIDNVLAKLLELVAAVIATLKANCVRIMKRLQNSWMLRKTKTA